MRKCLLYVRISSDQQSTGDGIPRQKAKLLEYLQNNSDTLDCNNYELIVDSGKSGWKAEHLHSTAGLGKLFTRIEANEPNGAAFLVESLDRYSRENPFKVMSYLNTMVEHGIELHDVSQNLVISPRNKMSLTMATIIAQRAWEESVQKSVRIKKGWGKRRDKAKSTGQYMIKNSPPWISIENDKYILNEKASIVREIFDLYLSGIGSYTIGKKLNEEKKYLTDVLWTTAKVCRILRNVRCKGDYLSNGIERDFETDSEEIIQEVIPNLYPAVVTETEFDEVQRRMKGHNYAGRIRDNKKQTVFGGILKCALCNEALTVKVNGKYRYAKCIAATEQHGCKAGNLNYTVLEKAVLAHIQKVDFERIYKVNDVSELDAIKGKIVDTQAEIETFTKGIAKIKSSGRTPTFEMLDTKSQLEEKLDKLKVQLSQLESNGRIKSIELTNDIYAVDNVTDRSRLEVELKRSVKDIKIRLTEGNLYVVNISYHSDVAYHLLVLDKKGSLLSYSSLTEGWLFESPFMTLNFITKETTYHREANQVDKMVIEMWKNAFDIAEQSFIEA